MERLSFRTGLIAVIIAGLTVVGVPVRAQDEAPPAAQNAVAGASVVLARIASGDPHAPDGYSADVELHVKLHSFPFLGANVHGTSTYRRPGQYHYMLQNVPRIAGKFDDLRYDLGDPVTWALKYEISLAPQSTDDGPVLRLTPKHPGLVTALDIETDAKHGRMLKATWRRKDGGTIVLTQTYATVGASDVVTLQHADIDIPHMHAELTAAYTNVTIDQPMFATVLER
jgi:hypothetical protein